jgi:hypothetical protein
MKSLLIKSLPVLATLFIIGVAIKVLDNFGQARYDAGYALAKSMGDTELAELREEHATEKRTTAEAATTAALAANAELRAEQARANQLTVQLADAKLNLRKTTDQLTGEISRVTTLYRRALGAQPEPLPVAVFTTGFVRVWNSANGISTTNPAVPAPKGASRVSATPDGTGTADDLDSGVGQDQLLTNQVRNAELHGICRAQLNGLIDWTLNGSN